MGSEGAASRRAQLDALAERVRPVTLAREQRLPVLGPLEPLLPDGGLRRGITVSVGAMAGVGGATSLALALAAGPSISGSWVAAVGLPSLGLVAAAELGVDLERFVLVAEPEPEGWSTVVAALVDGFDVVVLQPTHRLRPADARRLDARARERGSILIFLNTSSSTDLSLRVTSASWEGLDDGYGHLRARRVTVAAGGRGASSRPRQVDLLLPGADGQVEVALDPPTPLRHRNIEAVG